VSFGQHICILELDLNEQQTIEIVRELHVRFGTRIRTTTKTRWLHDAQRAPVLPMGKPSYGGNIRTARLKPGVGARAA
jgi:hypothetical protein